MNENKKPREYKIVIGGNDPPPVDGLVVGAKEGILKRLVAGDRYEWNDWRENYPDLKIDLSGSVARILLRLI